MHREKLQTIEDNRKENNKMHLHVSFAFTIIIINTDIKNKQLQIMRDFRNNQFISGTSTCIEIS